ncbi:(d)CMP kinase [Amnibacterium sp. CER49]|uniref:(d)CMP kinase n=1 Tax=Amnibacterium sp. CER49 TaxID=3039161 RepID=UPI00244A255D|nr:(d)CMP kinase [Amnibacterium sp. CER49]MDH2444935.1 (d)CMP kinase [Amnibacterium sp. CER49]
MAGGGMGVIVAVDGPAGSGKSSVSRAAARRLGYGFLDTGAAYRALAWAVLDRGEDPDDPAAVERVLSAIDVDTAIDPDERWVRVDGIDVTGEIRESRVTGAVSGIARVQAVRQRLNEGFRARLAAAEPGVVVEGRDITTVVAPDADVRVLLTADPEVRAARRARELPGERRQDVARAIAERDAKDSRVVDFLEAADGVATLDSTELDFDGTVDALVGLVREGATAR